MENVLLFIQDHIKCFGKRLCCQSAAHVWEIKSQMVLPWIPAWTREPFRVYCVVFIINYSVTNVDYPRVTYIWVHSGSVQILSGTFITQAFTNVFLLLQIGSRSSVYSPESSVRKTGSYIYEEFMPTDGTDVKVQFIVNPQLCTGTELG